MDVYGYRYFVLNNVLYFIGAYRMTNVFYVEIRV